MTLNEAIFKHLAGDADVLALVAKRIHRGAAPHSEAKPYIVYKRQGQQRDCMMDGPDGLPKARINLFIYADADSLAQEIYDAVRTRMDGSSEMWGGGSGVEVQGCFLVDDTDDFVPSPESEDAEAFSVSMAFDISYTEPQP